MTLVFRRKNLRRTASPLIVGLAILSINVLPSQVAGATSYVVTSCKHSGTGSLPSVVSSAPSGGTVRFAVACPAGSPIGLTATIDINKSLTIDGPGSADLVISGMDTSEVFDVSPSIVVFVSGLTVEDGTAKDGGGIYNHGTLHLSGVTVSDNTASDNGGGVYNKGALDVSHSDF